MKRVLLGLAILAPLSLGLAFVMLVRAHHAIHVVATVEGPPGDARTYELLLSKGGRHVFRPADQTWSAEGSDYYGRTDITAVQWDGPRSLTLELGNQIVMEVDGDRGAIRYFGRSATLPADAE